MTTTPFAQPPAAVAPESLSAAFVPNRQQRQLLEAIHESSGLVTVAEICERAGTSPATYYRWCKDVAFTCWLTEAWLGRLLADSWQLINMARAQAPNKIGYWRALYRFLFEQPTGQVAHTWIANQLAFPIVATDPAVAGYGPDEPATDAAGPSSPLSRVSTENTGVAAENERKPQLAAAASAAAVPTPASATRALRRTLHQISREQSRASSRTAPSLAPFDPTRESGAGLDPLAGNGPDDPATDAPDTAVGLSHLFAENTGDAAENETKSQLAAGASALAPPHGGAPATPPHRGASAMPPPADVLAMLLPPGALPQMLRAAPRSAPSWAPFDALPEPFAELHPVLAPALDTAA